MFGVVICPNCNRPRGVNLSAKKAMCPACGKHIDLKRAKIYFETDSEAELAEAVRKLSEQTSGGLEDSTDFISRKKKKSDESHLNSIYKPSKARDDEDQARILVKELSARTGEFSLEDLCRVIGDEEEAMTLLEKLLSAGIIFEPRPGRYRPV
ncbi:MAG: DUF1922 domain-containing protein [Methanomassiliicoccales archaeon]|nr:DUF1922 domain-containing protein [Methanomassiliicoccales archaeon]